MPYSHDAQSNGISYLILSTFVASALFTSGCAQPEVYGSDNETEETAAWEATEPKPEASVATPELPTQTPLVRILPGAFIMGTTHETGRWDNEGPQHTVALSRAIDMQAHEVTQEAWRWAFDSEPSDDRNCGKDCPVESINWYEALHYANWLSQSEGLETCYTLNNCDERCIGCGQTCDEVEFAGLDCQGYRLPTEAEWEYAARAGTHTAYYSGHASNENKNRACSKDEALESIGWYCANADDRMHPVAQLAPNAWGLYDMSGNIQEWVWDRYGSYSHRATTDPIGPREGAMRVARGGAWNYISAGCRAAYREHLAPDAANNATGFRLVRTVSF